MPYLVSVPDPNNPSTDRFQCLARGVLCIGTVVATVQVTRSLGSGIAGRLLYPPRTHGRRLTGNLIYFQGLTLPFLSVYCFLATTVEVANFAEQRHRHIYNTEIGSPTLLQFTYSFADSSFSLFAQSLRLRSYCSIADFLANPTD